MKNVVKIKNIVDWLIAKSIQNERISELEDDVENLALNDRERTHRIKAKRYEN